MSSFVYIKVMSGDIIPIEIPESLKDCYKIANLRSEYAEYLAEYLEYEETKEDEDREDIDLARIVFFDDNLERVEINDIVIPGNTYQVLVSDPLLRISFDRTIRLEHDYAIVPRHAHLEIVGLNSNAYRYMYNEIEYVYREDFVIDGNAFGREEYNIYYNEDDEDRLEKFRLALEKYNLKPLEDDFDFDILEEDDKINLIKAYLEYCLCTIIVDSYKFI